MTPAERSDLQEIGQEILNDVAVLTSVTCLYGILVILVVMSTFIQLRKGLKATGAMVVTLLTWTLFATSTGYWIAHVIYTVRILQGTFFGLSDVPLAPGLTAACEAKYDLQLTILSLVGINRADIWFYNFNLILSDAVVVWRTCVLWDNRKKLTLLPLALMGATFAAALVNAIMYSINRDSTMSVVLFNVRAESAAETASQLPVVVLSFLTNVVSTALIQHKARFHRRFIKACPGHKFSQSASERIVVLLVESGVFYCCCQLMILILAILNLTQHQSDYDYSNSTRSHAIQVIVKSMTIISAIYPTFIIVLVNANRSLADMPGMTTAGTSDPQTPLQPLVFSNASHPRNSLSDEPTTRSTSMCSESTV